MADDKVADPEQPSAALADELEERACTRVQLALFSVPPLKAEDTVEWKAARALRTLSRELFDLRTASLRSVEPAPRGEQINEIPLPGRYRIVRACDTWQLFDGCNHVRWLNEHECEFIDCALRIAREGKPT